MFPLGSDTLNAVAPNLDLARRLTAQGRLEEAFLLFLNLLDGNPQRADVRAEFGAFLFRHLPAKPHPTVDRALTLALKDGWIQPERLAPRAVAYLAAKYPAAFKGDAADLLTDPLTVALLQATPAATPDFERLLARFRRDALAIVTQGQPLRRLATPLAALAIRAWHSGYALVLPLGEEDSNEARRLAQLGAEIDQGLRSGNGLLDGLLVLACYGPPDETRLALASGPFAQALEQRVAAPRRRQRRLARDLAPITGFDPTSALVAGQYEQHPYPAWAGLPPAQAPLPQPVIDALAPGGPDAVARVLVAGCGTGQTALSAPQRWPKAEILGLDLSRASLAYAMDCASELGVARVSFALGDLLQLAESGLCFQVIEATGVLHHLADPAAGLSALAAQLDPGGVMHIALYSAAARRNLTAVRQAYGRDTAETDEEVRAFRAWALAKLDRPEVLYSPDFYSIGGCRDLIFHVREQAYDLNGVAELIDGAGLKLLALNAPPAAQGLLQTIPGPTDLAGWDAVERERPNVFGGMYGMWLRKPA